MDGSICHRNHCRICANDSTVSAAASGRWGTVCWRDTPATRAPGTTPLPGTARDPGAAPGATPAPVPGTAPAPAAPAPGTAPAAAVPTPAAIPAPAPGTAPAAVPAAADASPAAPAAPAVRALAPPRRRACRAARCAGLSWLRSASRCSLLDMLAPEIPLIPKNRSHGGPVRGFLFLNLRHDLQLQLNGQRGNGGLLEEACRGNVDVVGVLDHRQQLDRQQGVAAQLEQ